MRKYIAVILLLLAFPVLAAIEIYDFQNPEMEARYRKLTDELRCLVCQNQNIADSHAELAQDLRRKVYEMLGDGNNDDQIIGYMTDRYGDFVLYRPPLKTKTLVLWLAPALAVLFGLIVLWRFVGKKGEAKELPSDEKLKSVREILNKND